MCINPRVLTNGAVISCRVCWQCLGDRNKDWVGRCIAEAKASAFVVRGCFTYGRNPSVLEQDHPHASSLHYEDVQLLLKRLRKHTPGGVRFFCAGEYGERKSRTHWHILLFFKKQLPPNIQFLRDKFLHGWQDGPDGRWGSGQLFWEHGWSFYENFTGNQLGELVKGIRYVCKYVTKDQGLGGLKSLGISVKPPLGDEYFRQLAGEYVLAGLSPADFKYRFGDVRDPKGRVIEFWLQGSSQVNFLGSFCSQWLTVYGHSNWPVTPILEDFEDELVRRERVRLGLPDYSEDELAERLIDERLEKEGLWPGREGREEKRIERQVRSLWHRVHKFDG